jgi:DnaJ-class molecular chaperone
MELTLYDLLGIPLNADPIAIDTAYLAQLRQVVHSGEAPAVAVEVLRLTHAYRVLVEVGRRAAYDHALDYVAMARDGYDAIYRIRITAAEAQIGTTCTLSFHQPDGHPYDITVPIPPGRRHGDRFRLVGAGGPSVDGMRRGDLVVELIVNGP